MVQILECQNCHLCCADWWGVHSTDPRLAEAGGMQHMVSTLAGLCYMHCPLQESCHMWCRLQDLCCMQLWKVPCAAWVLT